MIMGKENNGYSEREKCLRGRIVHNGDAKHFMRCFVFDLAYDDFVEPVARLVIAENVSEARRLLDEYMAKDGNAHWRIVSQAREINMSSPDSKGVINI